MSNPSNLKFLNDLKTALKNYGDLDDEISPLKLKKDEINKKIREWINMHSITEFETLDITDKTLWRMSITKSERKDVNHEYLQSILSQEQLNNVYKRTTVETFKCSRVKSYKRTKKSEIPTGSIN